MAAQHVCSVVRGTAGVDQQDEELVEDVLRFLNQAEDNKQHGMQSPGKLSPADPCEGSPSHVPSIYASRVISTQKTF